MSDPPPYSPSRWRHHSFNSGQLIAFHVSHYFAATGATLFALLLSLSSHITMVLFSSFLAFIAALLTLIAFAIDIAFYIIVRDRVRRLPDVQVRTVAAPGKSRSAEDPYFFFYFLSAFGIANTWNRVLDHAHITAPTPHGWMHRLAWSPPFPHGRCH
jgi:hypothetical protein